MIHIFCTDYEVAKPIIKQYKLKKKVDEKYFELFRNDDIRVVLTGKSAVRAAVAAEKEVQYSLAAGMNINADAQLFMGIIRADETVLYNSIYDTSLDKFYYPDVFCDGLTEAQSTSLELSGLYQCLNMYVDVHHMAFMGMGEDATQVFKIIEGFESMISERKVFSHVYVEQNLLEEENPTCKDIISKLSSPLVVPIRHYKDVFNRNHQDIVYQKNNPSLIIASTKGRLVYDCSRECPSFGNEYFYYTTSVMNCLFDCEYCYLQGMYPSGNVVVFVNIEDIFEEVDRILEKHPAYICVSFDTDLIALENILGYAKKWAIFAASRENLTIEIRTKGCVSQSVIDFARELERKDREKIIFAFTLSPKMVQLKYEHRSASVEKRIDSLKRCLEAGLTCRVCFDPVLCMEGAYKAYEELISELFAKVDAALLRDVSLGQFRLPCEYYKKLSDKRPSSEIFSSGLVCSNDSYSYGDEGSKLTQQILKILSGFVDETKIFLWDDKKNGDSDNNR